ncbi:hypothetical protein BS17DRAFT_787089 [Gyrodon lividus]|nr:hypothetical protein BS17DRAFT_787089 [Gyrodon lividus]
MPILSAISDTITLLLNTPIVPPPDNMSASIALTEIPRRSRRGQQDGLTIEQMLSGRSEAANVFALGVRRSYFILQYQIITTVTSVCVRRNRDLRCKKDLR